MPLHLCGFTIFIALIHALKPNKTTHELLYSLCFPGAMSALLFPDWMNQPLNNFFCIHSFTIHMNEVAFVVIQLVKGEIRPRAKNLWRSLLFLSVTSPIIYVINKQIGTNFFYLNTPAPDSPISALEKIFGNPGYIAGLLCLVFAVWFVMYLPFEIHAHAKGKRARQ